MKRLVKVAVLLSVMAVAALSCVNDNITEPVGEELLEMLPSVEEQVSMMEASLSDIVELEKAARPHGLVLAEASEVLKSHVAVLKAGVTMEKGALATLDVQKKLADVLGQAAAGLDGEVKKTLGPSLDEINAGICAWLGESFASYYPVAEAESRMKVLMSGLCETMDMQELYADALVSDVEAGLRKDEKPEELARLVESVGQNSELADELEGSLSSLAAETEKEYRAALTGLFADPASFDAQALGEFNAGVETEVKSAAATLSDLMNRVAVCDEKLEDIRTRLGAIEADINQLLEMIQSVEFMPENDSYNAVAYYDLDITKASSYQGKKQRVPAGTIEMCYLVRPAASANALAEEGIWNTGMKMIGYYADGQPVSTASMMDFAISDVVVNLQTGVVKVKMENNLSEAFYFKEAKAKLALSLATGKADLTSKFVDIVPKDRSGTVYLETITLSKDEVEIDEGDELNLSAIFSPNNVTNKELVWTSDDNTVAIVSSAGRITGTGVGETHVRVTSKGTDEWGNTLSASCRVKVNPAMKLSGPSYVEQGKTADLTLDYPASMLIESKVWYTSDETKVTASNEGVITGVNHTYNEYTYEYTTVTVYCKINDAIVLSHDVKVVVPQPRQVKFNDYADNVSEITMKLDQTVSLAGTVLPAEASTNFRLFYESTAGTLGWIDSSSGLIKGSSFVGDVTVYARVFEIDKHHRFAPGKSLTRAVTVKVEPYWVESVTLPATLTLAPDATATLTPTFTSDVSGKQPTNTSLTWSSSNPSIVSINSTTGEMIAHSVGTVQITATTASGAASGSEQKSANCIVTVKAPVAPIAIGDYFYSDGTWSTERDNSKTVIGIVFATVNATGADSHLRADYPECINGLVVSTVEYTSSCNANRQWSLVDMANWCYSNGYTSYWDQSNTCGYSNTKGYFAVNAANINSYGYTIDFTLFNSTSPVVTHRNSVSVPTSTSAWYVPSYKEMQLLYENRAIVNERITAVGGTGLHVTQTSYDDNQYRYWTSTNDFGNKVIRTFNMMDSGGGAWYSATGSESTSFPVRVVLAF